MRSSEVEEGLCTLEVNVMAAEDLKDVNVIGKMKPYVVAWIDDHTNEEELMCENSRRSCSTRICTQGGKHPFWNQVLKLPIYPLSLRSGTSASLNIHIYTKAALSSTPSLIGSVQIPAAQFSFLARRDRTTDVEFLSKEVSTASGKVQGTLHLAIRLESSRPTDEVAHARQLIRANTGGGREQQQLRSRFMPYTRWASISSMGEAPHHQKMNSIF